MINTLLVEIEDTTKEYLAACNATSVSRNNETALLNELNAKQKAFDEALLKIKAQSPRDSDWKASERTFGRVE